MAVKRNLASTAEPRVPLTRRSIVDAAMLIVDADGLDALTMRRLAGDLGVATTAIYWHLRTRDEVLMGMLEVAVDELETPKDDGCPWQDDIIDLCRSMRALLLRHPWIPLVRREFPGVSVPHYLKALYTVGQRAGFDADETVHIARMLGTFVVGSALRAAGSPPQEGERETTLVRWAELGEQELLELMPALARIDDDAVFERGLHYLVDGLAKDFPTH
jgi:AcrR family transcriptional regulator